MEAKKYATSQPMDHWRNQRGNQNIPRDKWQWKHNNPKPMAPAKAVLRGKFTAIISYLWKQKNPK